MDSLKLGDVVIAVPLGMERPTGSTGHVTTVRGVVLWDYANGTIVVQTHSNTYVCTKSDHPIVIPDSALGAKELQFALDVRDQLIAEARRTLQEMARPTI